MYQHLTRINSTLQEDQNTFLITPHSIFLESEIFQTKAVEKIKTHILCSVTFFFLENLAIYEKMWKNIVERGRPQMTIWQMRIACWIPKATNTHSQYVIVIAFPLQQWLRERASTLRYTCIACLVLCSLFNYAGIWLGYIASVGGD